MKKILLTTLALLSAGIANASYIGYELNKGFTESNNSFSTSAVVGHYHTFSNCPFYTDVKGTLTINPDNGLSDWGIDANLGTVQYITDKTFLSVNWDCRYFRL